MIEQGNTRRTTMLIIVAGLFVCALLAGAIAFWGSPVLAQTAGAGGGEVEDGDLDDAAEGADAPIAGPALEQAGAAALKYTGGGRITGAEVGDEEGYYEIEVTLPNGRQVDVHLDASFNVLGAENE